MMADMHTGPTIRVPQVVAFYEDTYGDEGVALGWNIVAAGLSFTDGSVAAIRLGEKQAQSVTQWANVDDATAAYGGYVDTVDPRSTLHGDLTDHLRVVVDHLLDAHRKGEPDETDSYVEGEGT